MESLLLNHPIITDDKWENFTETEHNTWKLLFERQAKLLKNRAVDEIIEGMKKLTICSDKIPKIVELNRILKKETDFSIVPVTGYIPEDLFFKLLSERKFPTICFIRKPHELDYAEAPDIFHDVFGHVPLLVNAIFADFMQQCGIKYLEANKISIHNFINIIYWFTIEFGLMETSKGLRIYGAGIISSRSETIYSVESPFPERAKINLSKIMDAPRIFDSFQKIYFIIRSFQQVFDLVNNLDLYEIHHKYSNINNKVIMTNKETI